MKQKMKRALWVLVCLMAMVSANAQMIDGVNYKLNSSTKEATVKSLSGSSKYTGHVAIPSSITSNGKEYSVTSIDGSAFRQCSGLTSVIIPNSVTSIGYYAFLGCSGLTSVTIPNSVTSIGKSAFYMCRGLTSVSIPNSVKSIEDNAFSYCSGLTSVTIPNSVTSIGNYAFLDCSGLTSVTIPNSVTSIRESAFRGCSGLTSVTIPSSVISIGASAFSGCSGLTSVTIPNSVTSIGNSAFSWCRGLTSVSIPNSVKSIEDNAFSYCSGLTSVTIPNSVTSIGNSAFYSCSGLTSVTIPNSVTSIGNSAFSGCSDLTSVTIPESVKAINEMTFESCTSLKDIYYYLEYVPTTSASAFQGVTISSVALHVPSNTVNDYKNIEPWSDFGEIVALKSNEYTPTVKKCATPTISYTKGKLSFKCSTNGASCVSTITDADIKTHNGNEIDLTVTYNISVYAKATDYEDSDIATATLCWIDSNPKTEGIANGMAKVEAKPVLIQSSNGVLTITSEGNTEVTPIKVYNTAGQMKGSSSMTNGMATLDSNMDSGEIAIVKIGEKSVKVVVK